MSNNSRGMSSASSAIVKDAANAPVSSIYAAVSNRPSP